MNNYWAIQFFTGYRFQYRRSGTVNLLVKVFTLNSDFADSLPLGKIKGRLLYLWPNRWGDDLRMWNQAGEFRIRPVDEKRLKRRFGGGQTVFVTFDEKWRHLEEYFFKVTGTEILSDKPPVFRVSNFSPAKDFGPPRVAVQMGKLLSQLRNENPANYLIVRNKLFPDFFGFKPEQVDGMADLDEDAAGLIFIEKGEVPDADRILRPGTGESANWVHS